MRFLPVVCINSSFPVVEYCSIPLYGYINLCTQIPAGGHFDFFQFPAIINKAALRFFFLMEIHLCCVVLFRAQSRLILSRPHGRQPTRLLCPWDFPGKNTTAGCHFLLQGIFLTQGSNVCFFHVLHWQMDYFWKNAQKLKSGSGRYKFNFLLSCQTSFQSTGSVVCFPARSVPVPPHTCQSLVQTVLLILDILVGTQWYSHYGFNLDFPSD